MDVHLLAHHLERQTKNRKWNGYTPNACPLSSNWIEPDTCRQCSQAPRGWVLCTQGPFRTTNVWTDMEARQLSRQMGKGKRSALVVYQQPSKNHARWSATTMTIAKLKSRLEVCACTGRWTMGTRSWRLVHLMHEQRAQMSIALQGKRSKRQKLDMAKGALLRAKQAAGRWSERIANLETRFGEHGQHWLLTRGWSKKQPPRWNECEVRWQSVPFCPKPPTYQPLLCQCSKISWSPSPNVGGLG